MVEDIPYERSRNQAASRRGARAGESFATSAEVEDKAGDEAFANSYPGASGIAGARVRSSDAYKKALEADRAKRKKKRTAADAAAALAAKPKE